MGNCTCKFMAVKPSKKPFPVPCPRCWLIHFRSAWSCSWARLGFPTTIKRAKVRANPSSRVHLYRLARASRSSPVPAVLTPASGTKCTWRSGCVENKQQWWVSKLLGHWLARFKVHKCKGSDCCDRMSACIASSWLGPTALAPWGASRATFVFPCLFIVGLLLLTGVFQVLCRDTQDGVMTTNITDHSETKSFDVDIVYTSVFCPKS